MTGRPAIVGVAVGLSLLAVPMAHGAGAGRQKSTPSPNIVLIVVDDVGWGEVGFRNPAEKTPAMDGLMKQGVALGAMYAAPVRHETQAALCTGRYPLRHRLVGPSGQIRLDPEERTLADSLRKAGYATYLVGSWGLGFDPRDAQPMARGYQHHYGSYTGDIDLYAHTYQSVLDWHRDGQPSMDEGHAFELLADEAVRVIRAHDPRGPRLFLHLSFPAPTGQAPQRYLKQHLDHRTPWLRAHKASVDLLDEAIGKVLAAVEDHGMKDGTVVVLVGARGGDAEHAKLVNAPLRGGTAGADGLYEGAFRVPAAISWPGRLAPGTLDAPAHVVDLYATLLRLAHAARLDRPQSGQNGQNGQSGFDGIDLWPILSRRLKMPERALPLSIGQEFAAIRWRNWKLVVHRPLPSDPAGATDVGENQAQPAPLTTELFDLAADPSEAIDLQKVKADLRDTMMGYAADFRRQAGQLSLGALAPRTPEPRDSKSPWSAERPAPKVWGDD